MLDYRTLRPVFRALASTTRLLFIDALQGSGAELRLDDFCELAPLRTSTVVHHLRVLEAAGLITSEKVGTTRFYRFRPEGLMQAAKRLHHLAAPAIRPYPDAGLR